MKKQMSGCINVIIYVVMVVLVQRVNVRSWLVMSTVDAPD